MAATLKTYLVTSATAIVVENPVFASSTSYQPGERFQELDNNLSVQRLLADGLVTEVPDAPATTGYVVVTGDPGPAGPTGPGAFNDLAITLGIGNVTGGTDILLTGGDKIMGGRACFGSSTAALVDGDLSAAAGVNELVWNSTTADLSVTDGTRSLGYTGATGQLSITGLAADVDVINVSGAVDGIIDIHVANTSAGTAARSRLLLTGDAGNGALEVRGSGHASDPDTMILASFSDLSGGLVISTGGAFPLSFRTNTADRWQITSAGHLSPAADNTYDIGLAGTNRVRDIIVGNSIRVGQVLGLAAAGDIRAGNGVNELFWDASDQRLTITGTDNQRAGIRTDAPVGTASFANYLACSDGGHCASYGATSAAYTGPNYPADAAFLVGDTNLSGGLFLATLGAFPITLATAGTNRWQVDSNGHLLAGADSTYDIGNSGALRPRTLYLGTSLDVDGTTFSGTTTPTRLSTTTGIDGTALGATALYTVPAGKTMCITKAAVRLTSVATFTSVPTLGIGIAAGENDIFVEEALLGLDAITKVWWFSSELLATLATAGQTISVGVDTQAVAGTYTIAIDLFGYEV